MTRLQKYRRFVLGLFFVSLSGLVVCGYFYLKDQVPDRILTEEGELSPAIFQEPFCSFIEEETVEAGSRGGSDIPEGAVKVDGTDTKKHLIKCSLFGVIPLKTVEVESTSRPQVLAGGFPVGIYMETKGILVIGTGEVEGKDGKTYVPAEHIVKSGDYIIGAEGKTLENKEELVECIHACGGEEVSLQVVRDGEELEVSVTPVQSSDQEYKAGIWVRSDAQGVGTLTFMDGKGSFGALGHGISDVDTSTLLDMKEGKLYEADIVSVTKGEKGKPGELAGVIHYQDSALLGKIESNLSTGIYGNLEKSVLEKGGRIYQAGYKQEIEKGPASILCCVGDEVGEYDVCIESVELNKKEVNKGMVLRVTDPELLEKTGGIVQGMSGSPIIQNGRIVGAVTHVFVNDPTKGYGIFIENMLGNS